METHNENNANTINFAVARALEETHAERGENLGFAALVTFVMRATVLGLLAGVLVLFFERPKLARNVAPGVARAEAPHAHDSFGLPYKPRGLF
ncbi:MAG: hypothetical protein HY075_13925 [Deltaproteobacteria bacterium]|nr:hypothetical protein [Deltaproteobacteria bacterium]